MPKDKDLKRLVRRRMAVTGEPYTAARAAIGAERPDRRPEPVPVGRASRWVELLAFVDHAHGAYLLLKALPPAQLRSAVFPGLTHESWRVRRSCAQLLDDVTLTDETTAALQRCLDDEHPKVRKAALHTLTCVHCKPDGCALDVRPLVERMANDPDRLVRRAVVTLMWPYEEDWSLALLHRMATNDSSSHVRDVATQFAAAAERRRRATTTLESLPPELRPKLERHRGKWVAVVDGRVVAAHKSSASVRRAVRSIGRPDAEIYCLA